MMNIRNLNWSFLNFTILLHCGFLIPLRNDLTQQTYKKRINSLINSFPKSPLIYPKV